MQDTLENARKRERLLDIAAKQIRQRGMDHLAPADLIGQAEITRQEFDAYFPTRDALICAATERALHHGEFGIDERIGLEKDPTVAEIVASYFHPDHIEYPETGCAICALAGEARRADDGIQSLLTRHLRDNAALLAQAAGGDPKAHQWSLAAFSAIVGAVTLARAVNDPALAQSILDETQKMIAATSKALDKR